MEVIRSFYFLLYFLENFHTRNTLSSNILGRDVYLGWSKSRHVHYYTSFNGQILHHILKQPSSQKSLSDARLALVSSRTNYLLLSAFCSSSLVPKLMKSHLWERRSVIFKYLFSSCVWLGLYISFAICLWTFVYPFRTNVISDNDLKSCLLYFRVIVRMVRDGYFGHKDHFKSLCDSIDGTGGDFYLLGYDFMSYLEAQVDPYTSLQLCLNMV